MPRHVYKNLQHFLDRVSLVAAASTALVVRVESERGLDVVAPAAFDPVTVAAAALARGGGTTMGGG
jgi:hypothetical protein